MFKKILQEKKLSVTKQRLYILETLEKLSKPVTIETLKLEISSSVDVTTLYRSLSLLVEKGIVYQTDFREGVAYYELQPEHAHHHHLVCTDCKIKIEYDYCPTLPINNIQSETGFIITNHIFEIFGLCKQCTKLS